MNKLLKIIYRTINIIGFSIIGVGFFLIFYVGVTGAFIMVFGATINILNIIFFWLIKFFKKKQSI